MAKAGVGGMSGPFVPDAEGERSRGTGERTTKGASPKVRTGERRGEARVGERGLFIWCLEEDVEVAF